tara:strand:- start:3 stop:659 length:657 start_codon:yes stop_codon:yes gene_type:complete
MILGIYGAGGLGREVYELASLINAHDRRWNKIIFIDDSDDVKDLRKIPIIDYKNLIDIDSKEEIEVCIGIGEPEVREKIYKKLVNENINISTLVHPDVKIPDSTKIGEGTIICKFVSITCDIDIGENVYVHPMACIGHDAKVGDHSIVSSFVDIAGDCILGHKTFLAIGVILKQGIKIGSNAIVGLGSVVHNDIPDSVIALGNPARPMKKNIDKKVFK